MGLFAIEIRFRKALPDEPTRFVGSVDTEYGVAVVDHWRTARKFTFQAEAISWVVDNAAKLVNVNIVGYPPIDPVALEEESKEAAEAFRAERLGVEPRNALGLTGAEMEAIATDERAIEHGIAAAENRERDEYHRALETVGKWHAKNGATTC